MLKLRAGELVIIGVSDRDLARLARGKPLLFDGDDLGLDVRFALMHGRDEEALLADVRGLGLALPPMESIPETSKLTAEGRTTLRAVAGAMLKLSSLERDPIAPCACPDCGLPGNETSGVGHNDEPGPGDWSICTNCGAVGRLAEDMTVRKATPAEWGELAESDRERIRVESDKVRVAMLQRGGERGQA